MEYRTAVESTIKDVDESKREVLFEFPHERLDTYKTTFAPDCFRESFARELPVACWQHKSDEPIGTTISAQVTKRANEMVGKLSDFDAVPLARRAFTQLKDGSLKGVSFGFERQADEKHPEHRGAKRITRALMREWSPVTFPSIPGAIVTGTREEQALMEFDDILKLVEHKVVSPEQARAMLATAGWEVPDLRAAFDTSRDPAREGPRLGEGAVGAADVRPGMTVTDGNDSPDLVNAVKMPSPDEVELTYARRGPVSYSPKSQLQLIQPGNDMNPGPSGISATQAGKYTMGNSGRSDDGNQEQRDEDAGELAAAIDAALDEADRVMDGIDTRNLPPEVQQALNLGSAASAAVDDLLEVMGVADADETPSAGDTSGRSDWYAEEEKRRDISQKMRDKIPNEDCAGKGDSFPIEKPEDVSAAFASLGRAGPDNLPPDQIKANIVKIAKRKGSAFVAKLPDSVKQEDAKREAQARAALHRMERRRAS